MTQDWACCPAEWDKDENTAWKNKNWTWEKHLLLPCVQVCFLPPPQQTQQHWLRWWWRVLSSTHTEHKQSVQRDQWRSLAKQPGLKALLYVSATLQLRTCSSSWNWAFIARKNIKRVWRSASHSLQSWVKVHISSVWCLLTSRNSSMSSTGWNMMNSRKKYNIKADTTKGPEKMTRKQKHKQLYNI